MKKIGLSGNILVDRHEIFPGYKRAYVNQDYIDAITMAQGCPLILPIGDEAVIASYIDTLDGLVLTGGQDVTPQLYGQEPHPLLQETNWDRDQFDLALIKHAKKKNIPILAICRGFQILNVYYGGTLYQDVSLVNKDCIKHNQGFGADVKTHTIEIKGDSLLHAILGKDSIMVNSFHHQLIHTLASPLTICARSSDGMVEAYMNPNAKFELAVQFHPEMMHRNDEDAQRIFKAFVEAC